MPRALCERVHSLLSGENDQAEVELAKSIELMVQARMRTTTWPLFTCDDRMMRRRLWQWNAPSADPSIRKPITAWEHLYARTGRQADGEEMVALFQA